MSITLSATVDNLLNNFWEIEYQYYQEEYEVEEPDDISTDKLEDCNYKDLRMLRDYIKKTEEENEKLKEQIKSRESLCNHFEIMNKKNFDKIKELQAELKLAKDGFKLLECVDCKCIILDDLQGQINKLKEENEKSKTDALCFSAQLNFAGEYSDIQDYTQFNEWIKENYKEDEYKKMYEWYVMEDYIEEE